MLSSGSGGNAVYIESGSEGILLDAGLSERALRSRMQSIGRDPSRLRAIFLSHEHSDHVSGAGVIARRYRIPVYSTEGTREGFRQSRGELPEWRRVRAGDEISIGGVGVEVYTTMHDALESVAFVVRRGGRTIGHATDLGTVTPLVREKLSRADALLVEANHDPAMLDAGPYPFWLKQRIKSASGHLSNAACAELLSAVDHEGLQGVVLMHLSETNNLPEIAAAAVAASLKLGITAQTFLARQDFPTPLFAIH